MAWYAADGDRIRTCLHPDLIKRSVSSNAEDGKLRLRRAATTEMMIGSTKEGGESELPGEDQTYEIPVLDIFQHIATVKIASHTYVDYFHLAKIKGRWTIVHDLCELQKGEFSD